MIADLFAWLAALAIVAGGVFGLLAGIGVLRLPDLYTRMHAASKAGLVGAGLTFVGIAIIGGESSIALRAILGIAFLAMTTPVSAHLLARAALRAGQKPINTETNDKSDS
jgi:multicomponent Na+:H+ antiporter subunit G